MGARCRNEEGWLQELSSMSQRIGACCRRWTAAVGVVSPSMMHGPDIGENGEQLIPTRGL